MRRAWDKRQLWLRNVPGEPVEVGEPSRLPTRRRAPRAGRREIAPWRQVELPFRSTGRKGRPNPRPRSISARRLTRAEIAEGLRLQVLDVERPRTRGDCADSPRPCPFVSCRHNLYLDINPNTGSLKLNFPNLDVWEMEESCSLDVADRGGATLDRTGALLNISMQRMLQLEQEAVQEAKAKLGEVETLMAAQPNRDE